MSDFIGTIIEESLEDSEVLKKVRIIKTNIEQVKESHKTPWVKQWTLHDVRETSFLWASRKSEDFLDVEIPEDKAEEIAKILSRSLDSKHNWYADFKNESIHYVIFRDKVFKINRSNKEQYDKATDYGISLGIPGYQVNFSPFILQ